MRAGVWRNPFVLGYLALYATFFLLLLKVERFAAGEALAVLLIVGVAFSALAWQLTKNATPLAFFVKSPAAESALLVAYLFLVAGFLAGGLNAVQKFFPAEPLHSLVLLAAKLSLFVLAPLGLLMGFWKYRVRDFAAPGWRRHLGVVFWMSLVWILFQIVFGRGRFEIQRLGAGTGLLALATPLAFLWLTIEVGLVEEFFFRTLLQSRLAALLRSEVAGIVLMSLVFGLVHAPGLYFRPASTLEAVGTSPSVLMAVGYSVVVTSVTGFFLGILWARTKNLVALALIHAAADLVPNLAQIVRAWHAG